MLLDACPKRITYSRARVTTQTDLNAIGILLVRNQADALLSMFRDKASSGIITVTADQWALKQMGNQEYNFTAAYIDSQKWGISKIIVIKSNDLKLSPNRTVNRVFKEIGLPTHPQIGSLSFNNPQNSARYRSGALSYGTKQKIENYWHTTNLELARLTGIII